MNGLSVLLKRLMHWLMFRPSAQITGFIGFAENTKNKTAEIYGRFFSRRLEPFRALNEMCLDG
ncbi:MAG TPA: hypothetical protein VF338_07460 [Leptolinea sp.]